MDVRDEIRSYLEDPETLYKTWYEEQTQYEAGIDTGEPVGVVEDLKKAFSGWVNTNLSDLRDAICPNSEKIKAVGTQVGMVLEIMDLIEEQPYVGTVKKAATLLLLYGIEKLCDSYEP